MRVFPAVTVKPTSEPVTLGELRASVHADGTYDDASLLGYLIAARSYVEKHTGWRFMPQTVRADLTAWPCDGVIQPAVGPINSTAITYTASDGSTETLDAADYVVRPYNGDPVLKAIYPSAAAGAWPTLGDDPQISVTLTVGFTDANAIDADLKHAIILLAAHWHMNREPVNIGNIVSPLPYGVDHLIHTNKLVML